MLAYRPAATMRRLPVTGHGFHLHEDDEVLRLVGEAGFEVLVMESRRDDGVGNCCVVAAPWEAGG